MTRAGKARLLRWGTVLSALALLEGAARAGLVRPSVLAPVSEVAARLGEIAVTGTIPSAYFRRAGAPSIGHHLGATLGFALGLSPLLREAYEGPIVAFSAVPKVTLFPIFLFRLGPESKIAFGAFHGLFPVAILTWGAMRSMRQVHLRLARSLRLSPWQTARCVIVPSVAPSVATGLRLAFTLTVLGVVALLALAANGGLLLLERRVARWGGEAWRSRTERPAG